MTDEILLCLLLVEGVKFGYQIIKDLMSYDT